MVSGDAACRSNSICARQGGGAQGQAAQQPQSWLPHGVCFVGACLAAPMSWSIAIAGIMVMGVTVMAWGAANTGPDPPRIKPKAIASLPMMRCAGPNIATSLMRGYQTEKARTLSLPHLSLSRERSETFDTLPLSNSPASGFAPRGKKV
jgi:hypothetical protein